MYIIFSIENKLMSIVKLPQKQMSIICRVSYRIFLKQSQGGGGGGGGGGASGMPNLTEIMTSEIQKVSG